MHCINAHHCAFEWLAVEEVKSNLCAFPGAPLVRDGHRWGLFSHQRLVEHLYLQHLLHYPHFHYGNVYYDHFDIKSMHISTNVYLENKYRILQTI